MRYNQMIEGARLPRTNNPETLKAYAEKGIYLNPNEPAIFAHPQGANSLGGMALDADTWAYNPASNGVPFQFQIEYTKKPIKQILFKRAYNQIAPDYQQGDFATQRVEISLQGINGSVSSYGDYSADPISDANYTWSPRDLYRFQTVIQYGDLEVEVGSKAKLDIVGGKRYSAAQTIAITHNRLFFLGNQTSTGTFVSKTFGLLNDPNLNTAISGTASPSVTWATSVAAGNVTVILNDFNKMFQTLAAQTGNNVTQESRLITVMSAQLGALLGSVTTLGITVADMIRKVYPNLEIVYAPEYTAGTANTVQMIAPDLIEEKTVNFLFAYLYRSHGTVRLLSSFQEKVSASSGGAAVLAPIAIVTLTGV